MAVTVLQIVRLDNGDIVLLEGDELPDDPKAQEPIVSIRFSAEVQELLGEDTLGVAEVMLDAATEFIYSDGGAAEFGNDELEEAADGTPSQPIVVH